MKGGYRSDNVSYFYSSSLTSISGLLCEATEPGLDLRE